MYEFENKQINQQSINERTKKTEEFEIEVNKIETKLNKVIKEDNQNNYKEISEIDTKLTYITFEIEKLFIDNEERSYSSVKINKNNQLKLNILLDKIVFLQEKLKDYQEKKIYNLQKNESKSLDLLSLIELIFSPLGFITGFYGMNFFSMGIENRAQAKSKSLYGLHHNYMILYMTIFVLFSLLIWYLHKNYSNKISDFLRNLTKKSEKSEKSE